MKRFKLFASLMMLVCLLTSSFVSAGAAVANLQIPVDQIEPFIEKQMKKGDIPGLEVVIVQGDKTTFQKGYGYADVDKKTTVTNQTLFELGSTSKAFTALAVMQLEQKGLISLKDPISKYLPWFYLTYKGQKLDPTLEQFLYHRTSIPFKSIGYIPQSTADDAMDQTVRTLVGVEVDHRRNFLPGEYFQYATINYDVLGLVIQKVTGQSYEEYLSQNVLKPLGMTESYIRREEAQKNSAMSKGYKVDFLVQHEYDAPTYRGNTPAGYVITNGNDIAKWLKTQLGTNHDSTVSNELIQQTHEPDRTVSPSYNNFSMASYAKGWFVYQKGAGEISHSGANPNYSSFLVFRPGEQVGVAVLANTNSEYTQYIGQSIMDMIMHKPLHAQNTELNSDVDKMAVAILCVVIPSIFVLLFALFRTLSEIKRGERQRAPFTGKMATSMVVSVVFLMGYVAAWYFSPYLVFNKLPWDAVWVWLPQSQVIETVFDATVGVLYFLYHMVTLVFPKAQEKKVLALIVFSLLSGLGNAFIIFIVNQTFGRDDNLTNGLLYYFIGGIVLYVFGQRFVRARMVTITNDLVFHMRMELTEKIMKTPFEKLERLESGKVQAALNNDTEMISQSVNVAITGVTSLVTLICCFVYLGFMNIYALLVSVLVIGITAGVYFWIGNQANVLWEKTRSIQNLFFSYINDLLHGFKELSLNRRKRMAFSSDFTDSCDEYRIMRTNGDMKFANVFVVGELLFTIVIGVVAFAFPLMFTDIQDSTLRSYVFVFLYMTGPVNGLLNAVPQLLQIRISWNRIKELEREISSLGHEQQLVADETAVAQEEVVTEGLCLELQGVSYSYATDDGSHVFGVGPISHQFLPGEIVFITGGNGSGKSTLGKLMTGLYTPHAGSILLGGEPVSGETLSQNFSAIFADFHLFDRLYGVDLQGREAEVESYLKLLHLDEKVQIQNQTFSTTRLSTGQKKRLALLVSYLEDKPICLFDEWAAEQDPEYRRYFYTRLLPEMKAKGKVILAITHDDGYFHLADKIIKLDMGKIVLTETKETYSVEQAEQFLTN